MKNFIKTTVDIFIIHYCKILVRLFYKDIWVLRKKAKQNKSYFKVKLYHSYLDAYGCYIGIDANFEDIPVFPHGLHGIFISNKAHIGKECVIFHQVTIGSNNLADSRGNGAPKIGNNTYIGCGAKIIGNVIIGNNSRIGANCIVTKDVPANSLCVMRGLEILHKQNMNNTFVPIN